MFRILRISILMLLLFISTFAVSATRAQATYYYRWSSAPAFLCRTVTNAVQLEFVTRPVEWNLPAGAQLNTVFIVNGIESASGPVDVAAGTSSDDFGGLGFNFPAYPDTVAIRLETIIGGSIVYTSTISAGCSADGGGTAILVNDESVTLLSFFYRWSHAPPFLCRTLTNVVQLEFVTRPVEWNLPAGAQLNTVFIVNGIESASGPVDVAAGTSSDDFGGLGFNFPAYPDTVAIRLETIIGGSIVYTSTISAGCSADGGGTATLVNDDLSGGGTGSSGGCSTLIPDSSVQGRLIETTTALFEPRADATTNIVLPAGSSWWVIAAQGGFYRLWIACQASPVWVPAGALGPNFDAPWGGAPLPASGA